MTTMIKIVSSKNYQAISRNFSGLFELANSGYTNHTLCQNLYPISDQNDSKATPFGAAHTSIASIRAYTPGFLEMEHTNLTQS